ncbi:hypothetical protein LCM20_01750 [Halobacillus litoralis]|uniref:hypothetical protein n=1 Tax=Halobacillus litoralis TaxID=45668 RepID=UPI001CD4292B|nr:hypothetical protein [Halobacillus litoralis]MCA0969311.1 hypothetical protein [Halobacillus litoralis]
MKRTTMILLIFMASLISYSPVSAESFQEVELSNGQTVLVNYEERSGGYQYEIRFENGRHYTYEQSGNIGSGSGSSELTMREMDLADEAMEKYKLQYGASSGSSESTINPSGLLVSIIGLIAAFFPYAAWYVEIGWKLRGAEPSDLALGANRVVGVVLAIVGLFIFF